MVNRYFFADRLQTCEYKMSRGLDVFRKNCALGDGLRLARVTLLFPSNSKIKSSGGVIAAHEILDFL